MATKQHTFLILFIYIISAIFVTSLSLSTAYAEEETDEAIDPAQQRVDKIDMCIQQVKDENEMKAAIYAMQCMKSDDPMLRSYVLEEILSSERPRVRKVGFEYLVETQTQFVVQAMPTAEDIKKTGVDSKLLMDELLLTVKIKQYQPATGQFTATVDPWGDSDGSIGVDGLTIIQRQNYIKLNKIESGYITGTAGYRLANTPGAIKISVKTPLP